MKNLKSIFYTIKSGLSILGIFGEILTILVFIFIILPLVGILIISTKIIKFYKIYILELFHYSRKIYKSTLCILDNFKIYRKHTIQLIEYIIEHFLLNNKEYRTEKIQKTKYNIFKQSGNLIIALLGYILSIATLLLAGIIPISSIFYFLSIIHIIPHKLFNIDNITFGTQIYLKIILLTSTIILILTRLFRLKKKFDKKISFRDISNYKSKFWKNEYYLTKIGDLTTNNQSSIEEKEINITKEKELTKIKEKTVYEDNKEEKYKIKDKKKSKKTFLKTAYIKIKGPKIIGWIDLEKKEKSILSTDEDDFFDENENYSNE